MHISQKSIMKEFPIIKQILKDPMIRQEIKLDEEELAYLENSS